VSNVAIYYVLKQEQEYEEAVLEIENVITKINMNIKGVYIDINMKNHELLKLLNEDLSSIDFLILNKDIYNEFDKALINELSRTEKFEIKNLNELL